MTPLELKNSILQLAIQGKLVDQRPEEGTAEDLYRQIQAEKQALIKAGKLKKEKPLPEIAEEEIPFDIPENWMWCYIGDLFQHNTGKALNGSDKSGTPMTYITTSNLYWDRFELEKLKEMPFTESEVEKCTVQKGDLLVCEGGDYGRSAIWPYDYPMRIQNHIHRLRAYGSVSVRYFYYCFYLYKNAGMIAGKGIAIQGLSANALHALKMPLPPFAEQKRIVAKIEELLPLIDRYEEAWTRLEAFNKRFPSDMQKSLLQLAIQGKLVPQRPEEGTGEDLYRQIQAEKQSLIRSGKQKKDKPLPEISEDESDIDIPDSWTLCKLGKISSKITDGEHKTPRRVTSYCGYYLLSARNIRDGYISIEDVDYVDKEEFAVISKRCNPKKGDVLISCSGSVGRCAVVKDSNNYVMVRSAAMVSPIIIDSDYLRFAIQSEYVQWQIRERKKQTAQANLFQDAICNLVIPLPPLAEQKRIAAKLEELLPLCEQLRN